MGFNRGTEYSITYRNMRGVDFSQGPSSKSGQRYSYLENMYRDYECGDGSLIESVPGFRKIASLGEKVHAIHAHKDSNGKDVAIVHSGDNLYSIKVEKRDETGDISPIIKISDSKSSAFRFGNNLYVLDGSEIVKITDYDEASYINPEDNSVYVPTTFYNGERIEQKNLLTDRFKEKYIIGALETVLYGSPGLLYSITDEARGLCAVVGVDESFLGIINIPSYTKIGKKVYKVDEIADNALSATQSYTEFGSASE